MTTQGLILAAGRGSRLGPNSEGIPKPLLQVGRRTLIEHQLEMLAQADVGPVGMVVGYCADEIERFVGPCHVSDEVIVPHFSGLIEFSTR